MIEKATHGSSQAYSKTKPQQGAKRVLFPTAADLAPRTIQLSKSYIVRSLNSTANKALHLGHLRNATLGAATAASLQALGAEVLRHCVIEDTGRFMTEAMVAVSAFQPAGAAASAMKPDHFIGTCYAQYRRAHAGAQKGKAAGTGYEALNDAADDLMRALARGDEAALATWMKVRTMALEGQQATLQRLGLSFDCCDYESTEDAVIEQFVADGIARGAFARKPTGEVVYNAANGRELRLVNRVGLPEESARLLSFICRLVAGPSGNCVNVIMAGSEWKGSMELYPEIVARLGQERVYDIYAQAFYGMVQLNGKKMASSAGSGVLVDDLLDQLTGSAAIGELSRHTGGHAGPSELAAMLLKAWLLSVARTEAIDFSLQRLHDRDANTGWEIVEAWTAVAAANGSAPPPSLSNEAREVLLEGLSRFSFDAAIRYARQAAARIVAGTSTAQETADFRALLAALSITPIRTDFEFSRAVPLRVPAPIAPRFPSLPEPSLPS